jgi:hypothetical protein
VRLDLKRAICPGRPDENWGIGTQLETLARSRGSKVVRG